MVFNRQEELLEDGLLLDHLLVLRDINEKKNSENKRIIGFINVLKTKEYLEGFEITDKGKEILDKYSMVEIEKSKDSLHQRCVNKLIELTGKKQVTTVIKGARYSFMCNERDLNNRIRKVITSYNLNSTQRDNIPSALIKFIEKCHKTKTWSPLLQYYILKDNSSRLVTDLDNLDEEEEEIKVPKKEENIIKNKDLFG